MRSAIAIISASNALLFGSVIGSMLFLDRRLVAIGTEALVQFERIARVGCEFTKHRVKIGGIAKVAINGCEADVGDRIELAQRRHDEFPDLSGRNLGFSRAFQLADKAVNETVDPLRLDRALSQSDRDRFRKFVAIKQHFAPGALDDRQLAKLNALERRETAATVGAHAAPPDGSVFVRRPAVFDLAILASAERTAHRSLLEIRSRDTRGASPYHDGRWLSAPFASIAATASRRLSLWTLSWQRGRGPVCSFHDYTLAPGDHPQPFNIQFT
jgi:hypothetical protein